MKCLMNIYRNVVTQIRRLKSSENAFRKSIEGNPNQRVPLYIFIKVNLNTSIDSNERRNVMLPIEEVLDDWDEWERRERENDIPDELKTIEEPSKEWWPVPDFPDYIISVYGEVYDIKRKKFLTVHTTDRGYSFVILRKNGKEYTKKLHRLVGQTFISNPENKPEINHKDGYKGNCRLTNLEWATRLENMRHASKMRLIKGTYNRTSFRKKPVKIVELNKVFESVSECARFVNGQTSKIADCASGKRKTHMGYHYVYIE